MEFMFDYGLFLAKTATLVAAFLFVVGGIVAMSSRQRGHGRQEIEITRLNDKYEKMTRALEAALLPRDALKKQDRKHKKERKRRDKASAGQRKRMFVINFDGDIRASHVVNLREEISAVLTVARKTDEIVVKVESGGGMVHAYGLAASQLERVRAREIPLTVCVDKVAASGGYLMACVANRVVAAPFAIIGSIGVIAQLPNFNKLLKRHDIEFEQITAGEFKRTLTMFGENTERHREKMKQDIQETHDLFKRFVLDHRPALDMGKVATGEYWLGTRAAELGLVDELGTSDDLLLAACEHSDILEVMYKPKQNVIKRLAASASRLLSRIQSEARADQPQLMM
ncbi:MAG: protease SohB [Proteobacteria bacterium]|nr:MAG: protease SohB [Pseudomonadota bacterium]